MDVITGKLVVKQLIADAIAAYTAGNEKALVGKLQSNILKKKIRFPLLEYAAKELYKVIPAVKQLAVADEIIQLHEVGGNVLAGIMLQLRLQKLFHQSIDKAVEYIIEGNEWYVCDIIGERVMGYALLHMPEETMPVLKKFATHEDKWIVRCIGVAAHYAIKKGLKKQYVDEMFRLLLSLSDTTEFHTKKGIGWAAKTTAKFHPEIIERYKSQVESYETRQWFKTKIKIGLGRTSKYAHRYTS